jgi:hypothetical protein
MARQELWVNPSVLTAPANELLRANHIRIDEPSIVATLLWALDQFWCLHYVLLQKDFIDFLANFCEPLIL